MVCPKCGKEIGDGKDACPFCGDSAESGVQSVFSKDRQIDFFEAYSDGEMIPAGDNREEAADNAAESADARETSAKEEPEAEAAPEAEPEGEEVPDAQAQTQDAPEEAAGAEDTAEKEPATDENERAQAPKRKAAPKKRAESKRSKRAYLTIRLTAILCAVLTVGLTLASAMTDVFKTDASGDKTMALSGLSASDKKSFEEFIPAFSALYETGYKRSESCFDDILSYLKPESENGLYAGTFESKKLSEGTDPAERFDAFTVVKSSEIHQIAFSLGLSAFDDANKKDVYYYGGKYYFKAPAAEGGEELTAESAEANGNDESAQTEAPKQEKTDAREAFQVKAAAAKKTQDGKYYISCELYPASAKRDKKGNFDCEKIGDVYVVALSEKQEKDIRWTVDEISPEPIFDDSGVKLPSGEEGALKYEMRKKVFKAKTSNGVEYASFIVEYPFFISDSPAAAAVNSLYRDTVQTYKKKASKADALYKKYKRIGGKDSYLPLFCHTTAKVTYNAGGYLSILECTSSNESLRIKTTPRVETMFSGNTINTETGKTVSKQEAAGRDYYAIQGMLFSRYTGLEPESDDENLGQSIYSGAWVLTEDGVMFCCKADGVDDFVTLGYDKLDTKLFEKKKSPEQETTSAEDISALPQWCCDSLRDFFPADKCFCASMTGGFSET